MLVLRRVPTSWILGFAFALSAPILSILWRYFPTNRFDQDLVPWEYEHREYHGDILGIEFSAIFSRVGVFRNSTFEIISDEQGRTAIPNYVAFSSQGPPLVGFEAKEQAFKNPKNTIFDFRSLLGRNFQDPEVQNAIREVPYDVVNVDGKPSIQIDINGILTLRTPEDISVVVFEKLKSMAEIHLNTTKSLHTVISVPSYFNEHQRQATIDAAELAGLGVERLVHESAAIAVAYGLDRAPCDEDQLQKDCTYLLYDIKENQYDLTLLNIDRGVFEVIEVSENQNLGWQGFDLSHRTSQSPHNALDNHPAREILESVQKILEKAKVQRNEIDGIVVSGDSLYLEEIRGILEDYFSGKKALSSFESPDTQAIVYGAAVQGMILRETMGWDGLFDWDYIGTTPLGVGIETSTGAFLQVIPKNHMIPKRKSITLTTSSDHQEKAVINIFCGEREIASKNVLLGTLELAIDSTVPKGELGVELVFEIDSNGVLKAIARIQGGPEVDFVVVPIDYTSEDIDRIVDEGNEFRDEDLRELAETPGNVLYGVEVREAAIKEQETLSEPTTPLWKSLFGWM